MTNRPMHLYIRGQDCHTYLCLSHNTDFHMGQRGVLPSDPVVRTQFGETGYISDSLIVRTQLTLVWNVINTVVHACTKRRDEYD